MVIGRQNIQNIIGQMTCQNSWKQSTNHTEHPLELSCMRQTIDIFHKYYNTAYFRDLLPT